MSDSICGICLESLTNQHILPCNHSFHDLCVEPWLAKKGTCPICRFQVCEASEASEASHTWNEEEWDFYDIERIRTAVFEFWRRRFPQIQSIDAMIAHHEQERQERLAIQQRERIERLENCANHIQLVNETDTEWIFEVDGVAARASKADITLVQTQTDATLPTCLYTLHTFHGDVVNAILEISGCI